MKNVVRGRRQWVVFAALTLGMAIAADARAASTGWTVASCPVDSSPHVVTTTVAMRSAKASSRAGVRPAAQVTRNEKADVTFEVRPGAAGGAEVTATSGDLRITKTVQESGEFLVQVTTAHDSVAIGVNARGTIISRGRTKIDLPRTANGAAPAAATVRRLLADSDAVLRYRILADALIGANDRSPASLAIIIADAMMGMLTGDLGAPRRIAQFLAARAAANVRPVGMALDCFALMEQRMTEAWTDYQACYTSVSFDLFSSYLQELCAARWVVQVESYWFGFLSCSGFNW